MSMSISDLVILRETFGKIVFSTRSQANRRIERIG
ncbi:hypothetical protein JMJ77_0007747, partial [Colletotrichum scovillei]